MVPLPPPSFSSHSSGCGGMSFSAALKSFPIAWRRSWRRPELLRHRPCLLASNTLLTKCLLTALRCWNSKLFHGISWNPFLEIRAQMDFFFFSPKVFFYFFFFPSFFPRSRVPSAGSPSWQQYDRQRRISCLQRRLLLAYVCPASKTEGAAKTNSPRYES